MLSDVQFQRLSHGAIVPLRKGDRRTRPRAPYSTAIKAYVITGKGTFDDGISVRCKDLSAAAVSFLTHKPCALGTKLLLRFPEGGPAKRPLNVIGTVVRTEKLSASLHLVVMQFEAVTNEESAVMTGPATLAEPAAPPPISMAQQTAELLADTANHANEVTFEDPMEAELARIRAAVLF